LGVVSDDVTLAARAAEALERDGLLVEVEAFGPDVRHIESAARRPTMMIVKGSPEDRELERTLDWASRRLPNAAVIVVLPVALHLDVGPLLALGADGVVLERDLDVVLGPVARAAACGHVSVPANLRHAIQRPALSHRERQILGLAVAGMTNAQIASRFFIAESTVKTHLSSAFRRMGVHSRREAAALIFSSDDVLRRSVLASARLPEPLAASTEVP
jgi:DNA-binding NarL/FixJ family response regulator